MEVFQELVLVAHERADPLAISEVACHREQVLVTADVQRREREFDGPGRATGDGEHGLQAGVSDRTQRRHDVAAQGRIRRAKEVPQRLPCERQRILLGQVTAANVGLAHAALAIAEVQRLARAFEERPIAGLRA